MHFSPFLRLLSHSTHLPFSHTSSSPALHPSLQRINTPSPSLSNPNRILTPTNTSNPPSKSQTDHSAWDFDLLSTSIPSTKPKSQPPPSDPFSLGFDHPPPPRSQPSQTQGSDFDLLGEFSQPAPRRPTPQTSTPLPAQTSSILSPPPELLLKLTEELGFSLPLSNAALLETHRKTGKFSLEDAVEILMQGAGGDGREGKKGKERSRREMDEWGDEDLVQVGRRRSWELPDATDGKEERRRRTAVQQRDESNGNRSNGKGKAVEDGGEKDQAEVLREQAQEVFDRAQKIGFGLFKTANAYWGQGKEVLTKKLEEQRKAAVAGGGMRNGKEGEGGNSGRPKWWKEGMDEVDGETNGAEKDKASGFKDSDDENEGPESVLPQRPTSRSTRPPAPRPQESRPTPPPAQAEYRSPFRRQKVTPSPTPPGREADLLSSPAASTSSPTVRSSATPRTPTPRTSPPKPNLRPPISISPSSFSSALKHKQLGNSHFKLGRYSDATSSYLLSLDSLPPSWIGRVSILNNLALSRLKSGEEKQSILDCTTALSILVSPCNGTIDLSSLLEESRGLGEKEKEFGLGDLREQLGKCLSRRAKGYEVGEKWRDALGDWEVLREKGDEVVMRGAGGIKVVGEGIERCRKALTPKKKEVTPPNRPPARKPRIQTTEKPSAAVAALQANQASQLAEEDLRLSLKDSVDSRITAWKGGKETNLRALLASLDSVLWEELGWKKVGMSELISEGQVKIKYVRAIAKVHPDKVRALSPPHSCLCAVSRREELM